MEGLPAVSALQHAAESDNPWAQQAYQNYLLVREAHKSPREDRHTRLARIGSAYEVWVERNSANGQYFNPDDPTPEQESELHQMQLEEDPTIMSVAWALEIATMTKREFAQLLRSEIYGPMPEPEIEALLAKPEHSWRLEGDSKEDKT